MAGQRPTLVESARREALLCGLVFVVAITWSVSYCVKFGYGRTVDDLTYVLGFPDWIFYGILAPWSVCTVIAACFSFGIMKDHDLEEPAGEHAAEDSDSAASGADVSESEEPPRE